MNPTIPVFVMTDGPDYAPNCYRIVEIIRCADVPQMFRVREIEFGREYTVHEQKLKLHWFTTRNNEAERAKGKPVVTDAISSTEPK